jgi:hypothetical protein
MDNGKNGDFTEVFNGIGLFPDKVKVTLTGLTTGLPYRFKVKATNFNGDGPESDPLLA